MRLLLAACLVLVVAGSSRAQSTRPLDCNREAIRFTSGRFQLSGDLLTPREGGPHPVIVYVWGAGPTNRQKHIERSPVLPVLLSRGFAVLLYDKPGSGESTGQVDNRRQFQELSTILFDAIAVLKQHDGINAHAIGLYGSSQASYVMATALARTVDVAFVIAWSCPMQSSVEQGAYLVKNYVLCDGGSNDQAKAAGDAYRRRARARTYADYRAAAEILQAIPAIRDGLGWAGVTAQEDFAPADTTSESFFDPGATFASLKIPILALYAENDRQIDPAQGAAFCRRFLPGTDHVSELETIPGADHNMMISPRGCMQDQRDDYKSVGGRTMSPMFLETLGGWLVKLRPCLARP